MVTSNEPQTRVTLLLKIRDGDDAAAWQEFVDIYAPVLNQYAVRRGLQAEDAADVVQDVLRTVLLKIDGFEYDSAKGKFRGWLHTVTRNHIVNHQKKNQRHRGSGDSGVQQLLNNQPGDHREQDDGWDETFQQQMLNVAMQRAKTEFTETNWLAFYRTSVEQTRPATVADQLQIKVGAVYVAKSRVVARLREIVEEFGGDWSPVIAADHNAS